MKLTRLHFSAATLPAMTTLFLVSGSVRAQVYINADTTINTDIGNSVEFGASGQGGSVNPTLTVELGAVLQGVNSYNTSTVNMSGGSVNGINEQVFARDSSTVNLSGGTVYDLRAADSASVNVSGGTVTFRFETFQSSAAMISGDTMSVVQPQDTSTLTMTNGTILGSLNPVGFSVVSLSGGQVYHLNPDASSTFNVSGGTAGGLQARGNSTVTMTGGAIVTSIFSQTTSGGVYALNSSVVNLLGGVTGDLYQYGASTLNLTGFGLTQTLVGANVSSANAIDPGSDLFTHYTLSGTLADGASVVGKSLFVQNGSTGSVNYLSAAVPEPGALALLALASPLALLARRRKGTLSE